jgi:hypothetical protein
MLVDGIVQLDAPKRQRSGCCVRVASGHTAAAPPSRVMNSRRFT